MGSKRWFDGEAKVLCLYGAGPCKASMCWSSSRSLRSTSTSLIRYVSKGYGGEQVRVDPSSNRGEGECLLAHLGFSGATGGMGSSRSMSCGSASQCGSKHATPRGIGVYSGMSWSASSYGTTTDAINTVGHWIAQTIVANSLTYWESCSRRSSWSPCGVVPA